MIVDNLNTVKANLVTTFSMQCKACLTQKPGSGTRIVPFFLQNPS